MEREGSLPYAKNPATCFYPDLHKSISRLAMLRLQDLFYTIYFWIFHAMSFLHISHPLLAWISLLPSTCQMPSPRHPFFLIHPIVVHDIKTGILASVRMGRGEPYRGFWRGNLKERDHLGDPDVDGRIILRWIFRNWDVEVWTWPSWLRIGTGGGHLRLRLWIFGFHKMRGIYWLATNLLASQEGLSSMK